MSCVFQKTSLIKLSPRYFEMDIVVDKKLVCPILSIAVCFDSLRDVNSVLWPYLRPPPCLILPPLLWPLSYYWMCGHVLSDSIVALRAYSWVRLEKTSPSQEPTYFLLTRWGLAHGQWAFTSGLAWWLCVLYPKYVVFSAIEFQCLFCMGNQEKAGNRMYVFGSLWHQRYLAFGTGIFCFKTYALLLGAVLSSLAGYLCSHSSRMIMLS